jgi:Hemerythrin HHE cation binding domain
MPSNDPFARLYQGMLPFHNHFRMEHAQIVKGIPKSQTSPKVSLLHLMQQALQLCGHLEMHHTIEEAHIFPLLAKKVPSFAMDSDHIKEHALMHAQLEALQQYSQKVLRDLQSSPGRKAENEGAGKVVKSEEEGDDDDDVKRKPWPTSIYDEDKFDTLIKGVAATLFPHLQAEEASLRPENLKKHGMTLGDIQRIPM